MTFTFKLSRRIARLRAPVLTVVLFTLVSCNGTDSLEPDSSAPATAVEGTPVTFSGAFSSGSQTYPGANVEVDWGDGTYGAVGTDTVGMVWLGEAVSVAKICCLLLIISGIVGLRVLE